jgi:serine/threonine-protein kinase RsbW
MRWLLGRRVGEDRGRQAGRFGGTRFGYYPSSARKLVGRTSIEGWPPLAAPRIQRRVPADAEQVPRLRAAIIAFTRDHCHHSEETRQIVALVLTEACSNVVRHAYPDTPGELTLAAWVDDDELTLVVADEGVGLDVETRRPGLGLGLRLMRELTATTITSNAHGTDVRLRFPRTSPVSATR